MILNNKFPNEQINDKNYLFKPQTRQVFGKLMRLIIQAEIKFERYRQLLNGTA